MATEPEVIRAVFTGDPRTDADFVRAYRPRLLRISANFVDGHGPEADEVVRETFRVSLAGMDRRGSGEPIYAWLRRICLGLCYARMRERARALAGVGEDLGTRLRPETRR